MKIDWYRGPLAVVAGGMVALALASPAHATETMEITTTLSEDGCTLTIAAAGELRVSSQTVTAGLVIQVPGEAPQVLRGGLPAEDGIHAFAASATVGPFDADTTVQWRIFGGPVREDDSPAWDTEGHPDWAKQVEAHEHETGEHWDALDDGPWVTWHSTEVTGCPTPDPETPDPDPTPTTEPTEPAPGKGGSDDQADELPLTGASMPILLAGGLGLAMAGGLAWLVGRRRRVRFTA